MACWTSIIKPYKVAYNSTICVLFIMIVLMLGTKPANAQLQDLEISPMDIIADKA